MSLAQVIYLDEVDEILEAKITKAYNEFLNAQGKENMVNAYLEFKRLLGMRSAEQIKKMEKEQGL